MDKICFSLGLRPRPRWGSSQRSPRPPRRFAGGKERRGMRRKRRGGKGEGKGRGEGKWKGGREVRRGNGKTSRSWLRHWSPAPLRGSFSEAP